ncbi:phage distal tail protein [Arthrobacter sp. ISL-72]|uniref:phage distal tail protein n=1 Tax=Arthrobacter sp. ISL-72 TaxID=2819114 RepID=UPI001BEC2543|nr:phage tail domain-containing protein [Arthrobacter sp. ISL-72]MBT2594729.1 phage tail family protein [Arthrobacter sp. ISL-72]
MAGIRTVTVDGLVFSTEGWTSPDGFTLWLDDLKGWDDGPAVRRDRVSRMGAHGEFSERGWRDARLVTLEGDAGAPTIEAAALAAQQLAAVLGDGLAGVLDVTDTATVDMSAGAYLFADPKLSWKNDTTLTYQLQFWCPKPRKYGAAVNAITGIASPGGGLTYPLDNPLDYGALGDPGTLTLTNTGTADTAPTFTVTGAMPNGFTITHVQSGQRLVYSAPILPGQSVRLDSSDASVELDGYADMSAKLTVRQWTRLARRTSGTWLFEAVGSTGATLTAEVRPAWW